MSAAAPLVHCDPRAFTVHGMGSALPGQAIDTDELLARIEGRFGLSVRRRGMALAGRLGVRTRHLCRDLRERHEAPRAGDGNAALAARAVRVALGQAGLEIGDVRYLIAHTATPGLSLPPGVAQVAELLGYDGPFVELRQACTGFANALVFAASLHGQQPGGAVVIVGSECGSVYFDPHRAALDTGQLINMLQMGDGAAAIVLTATGAAHGPRIERIYCGQLGCGRGSAFQLRAGGSDHPPDADTAPEFRHDFASVRRDGLQLFQAGLGAAASLGSTPDNCEFLIPHQANGRMAEWLAPQLSVSAERIFVNADRLGNTGSAAIWLALAALRNDLGAGQSALILGAEATKFMFGGFRYVHA